MATTPKTVSRKLIIFVNSYVVNINLLIQSSPQICHYFANDLKQGALYDNCTLTLI